jgi:ABC-type glycerol-3-phosphate transport system permease component
MALWNLCPVRNDGAKRYVSIATLAGAALLAVVLLASVVSYSAPIAGRVRVNRSIDLIVSANDGVLQLMLVRWLDPTLGCIEARSRVEASADWDFVITKPGARPLRITVLKDVYAFDLGRDTRINAVAIATPGWFIAILSGSCACYMIARTVRRRKSMRRRGFSVTCRPSSGEDGKGDISALSQPSILSQSHDVVSNDAQG